MTAPIFIQPEQAKRILGPVYGYAVNVMLDQLRTAGYAVVIYSPQDLGTAKATDIEKDLYEAGDGIIETINSIKE